MATSQVKTLHAKTGRRVVVVDPRGRPQRSPAFDNNPKIAFGADENTTLLLNAAGSRPYIHSKTHEKWTWKTWDISPGELFLSSAEKQFAAPFAGSILIEPNTKVVGGNKEWPFARWQEVVDRVGADRFVQVGAPASRPLKGVRFVPTTIRQGFAILAVSRAFVGSEGALHHAAAALDVPSIVLWSEFISPEFTGYTTQINLRRAARVCGSRLPCASCAASMLAISVDEVQSSLENLVC